MAQEIYAKSRERHTSTTWIDFNGHVRCTCIGSTNCRARAQANSFKFPYCKHISVMESFLNKIGNVFGCEGATIGAVFNAMKRDRFDAGFVSYISDLPVFSYAHKGTIAIMAKLSSSSGSDDGGFDYNLFHCVVCQEQVASDVLFLICTGLISANTFSM